MRRSRQQANGERIDETDLVEKATGPVRIPFAQRLTTIAEAYEVTGLGRAKLYELIGHGQISTTTIGRRRLVRVRSLVSLIEGNQSRTGHA
jgi:hypothetical protein